MKVEALEKVYGVELVELFKLLLELDYRKRIDFLTLDNEEGGVLD